MKQSRMKKTQNVAHRVHTRKLDRLVAKFAAKRMGLSRLTDRKRNRYKTKSDKNHGKHTKNEHYSAFSQRWRELIEKVS